MFGGLTLASKPFSRQLMITILDEYCIAGTFLYNATMSADYFSCQQQCAELDSCKYVVADRVSKYCTFYRSGNEIFSTKCKEVYEISSISERVS